MTESISQSNCDLHDKVIYVDSERREERERDRVNVRRSRQQATVVQEHSSSKGREAVAATEAG